MSLSLSLQQSLPLVEQIVDGVRAHIDDRILRPGARLPAIRALAEHHGISRFTVVEAYDRLVAQGYLASRRGAGFFVAARESATRPALPLWKSKSLGAFPKPITCGAINSISPSPPASPSTSTSEIAPSR